MQQSRLRFDYPSYNISFIDYLLHAYMGSSSHERSHLNPHRQAIHSSRHSQGNSFEYQLNRPEKYDTYDA